MNNLLPLGTIVEVKNKKYVIIGYSGKEDNNSKEIKDYITLIYPNGYDNEHVYMYNDQDIEKIIFYGYQTNEFYDYRKLIQKETEALKKGKSEEEILEEIKKEIEEKGNKE